MAERLREQATLPTLLLFFLQSNTVFGVHQYSKQYMWRTCARGVRRDVVSSSCIAKTVLTDNNIVWSKSTSANKQKHMHTEKDK